MSDIVIYTSQFCGYCSRAKMLLESKGVNYKEVAVDKEPGQRKTMVQRAGGMTSVPQIFIDDEHIGGCDDLYALEAQHKLDDKLQA